MKPNAEQQKLLNELRAESDGDGRVLIGRRPSREVRELIEAGVLEQNGYNGNFYFLQEKKGHR